MKPKTWRILTPFPWQLVPNPNGITTDQAHLEPTNTFHTPLVSAKQILIFLVLQQEIVIFFKFSRYYLYLWPLGQRFGDWMCYFRPWKTTKEMWARCYLNQESGRIILKTGKQRILFNLYHWSYFLYKLVSMTMKYTLFVKKTASYVTIHAIKGKTFHYFSKLCLYLT